MVYVLLGLLVWLMCSVLCYGRLNASFRSEYGYIEKEDRSFFVLISSFGPISAAIVWIISRKHACGFELVDLSKYIYMTDNGMEHLKVNKLTRFLVNHRDWFPVGIWWGVEDE